MGSVTDRTGPPAARPAVGGRDALLCPVARRTWRSPGGFWADRRGRTASGRSRTASSSSSGPGTSTNLRLAAGATGRYRALGEHWARLPVPRFRRLQVARGGRLGARPRTGRRRWRAAADEAIDARRAARSAPTATSTASSRSWRRRSEYRDLAWGHELYCVGHLIQAAVAWHRALGDDRLLDVAIRAADSVDRELGPGRPDGHRRPPRGRDGPRRAVPDDRRAPVPRPRAPVRRRCAGHGLLGAGRFGPAYWQDHAPGARGADGRRPRRPPAVPRLRRRRRRDGARRRGAARRGPAALARHGRDAHVPDRWARQPPPRRVVRRPVRAAARPGLRRDVRGDRQRHARLAPAPRDRRPGLRRRRSSGRSTTACCPGSRSTGPTSSTSTRSSGGRRRAPRRPAAGERRAVVPVCLLPAEPHAHCSARGSSTSRPPTTSGIQLHQYATRRDPGRGPAGRSASRSRPTTRGTAGSR